MPDGSGTSPNTEKSGENARSAGTNNYYNRPERPRNNIGGLEELTLIKRSRTPALDLRKAKEGLQNKIIREGKDGYEAAMLLDEAQSQPASLVGPSQQSGRPTAPTPPTIPDRTSDDFVINGTFNSVLYEAAVQVAVLEYKGESIAFQTDEQLFRNNTSNASGISKHTENNAHRMVATLMELLSDDLKVEVKNDGRFPSLKSKGDIKGLYDLVEEKVCGVGDGTPKVNSWIRYLKNFLNSWQTEDQSLANYWELKDAQRAFVSKLNEGGVTLAPDFLVHEVLREGGLNGNEIENLKYGSEELKKAKKRRRKESWRPYSYTGQTGRNLARRSTTWKTSTSTPLMTRRVVHLRTLPRRLASF